MFASTLFADHNDTRDFDRQIENLLRIGRADEAAAILKTTLRTLGDSSHPVVPMCLASRVEAIEIVGWDGLAQRLARLDHPGAPITALGIDISWHGHIGLEPDADSNLAPMIETSYYDDSTFPFSQATRDGLIAAYGRSAATWRGGMADIDGLLTVRGLDQLYGALCLLEAGSASEPDPSAADALRLGAAFVAVRLHQAVARTINLKGLPRPLAVIVGSNESAPYYDAPVASTAESLAWVRAHGDPEASEALDDETLDDEAVDAAASDDTVVQISGAALRQRLGQQHADAKPTGGFLRRLFAR